MDRRKNKQIDWACLVMRLSFLAVFILNVQCAVVFLVNPAGFAPNYELSGVAGQAAIRGLAIAFLMWNVTYPAFIVAPQRTFVLGPIILIQQAIGFVGEALLRAALPAGHILLRDSIGLFMAFDGVGLVIMGLSFAWWCVARRRQKEGARV